MTNTVSGEIPYDIQLDEIDKKIIAKREELEIVKAKRNQLNREILKLKTEDMELADAIRKGSHTIREWELQKDIIKRAYWRNRP